MRVGRDELGPVSCLELELEGELDRAGTADLIKRVEAGTIQAGQAARQRLCRVAEERIG